MASTHSMRTLAALLALCLFAVPLAFAEGEKESVGGQARVTSPFQAWADFNGNGRLEPQEVDELTRAVWDLLREPHDVRNPLDDLFDLNRDGEFHPEELPAAMEQVLRPHPRNDDFELDRELDRNRNGFIEADEIGIAAGVTPGGAVAPFEERLEMFLREMGQAPERSADEQPAAKESAAQVTAKEQGSPTVQKRLDALQDKKVAVVGLTAQTKKVDSETADGIVVFVENAFVNTGNVRVVDRRNIAKIVEEHQFQLSDIADESTAVQIGKLSGADIIAIGSISYVGARSTT